MENIKKYLNKFNLFEKLIAFFLSIALSQITIKSILLHDTKRALGNGVLYFFISLFLYFFISLFLIERHMKLTELLFNKIAKKEIKLNKKVIRSFVYPSFLLAMGFFAIFVASSYQVYLSLQPGSDFITNNSIAQGINSKYTLPIILIYIISIAILQIVNLSKIKKLKISISVIPTLFSLIVSLLIFFILTKVLLILYWIIIIFTSPWVPG